MLDKFGYYQVGDSWLMPHLVNQRSYTLNTMRIPSVISSGQCPVITLEDLQLECGATYSEPVPVMAYGDTLCATSETTEDHVVLNVPHEASEDDILQTRTILDGDVAIRTQFYWPPHPRGPTAGYTAPVIRWMETVITGLTETPIVLESSYAQTYQPGHHNFWETFMFEPRLDQNVSVDILVELEKQGIGRITAFTNEGIGSRICIFYLRDEDSSGQSNMDNDSWLDSDRFLVGQ